MNLELLVAQLKRHEGTGPVRGNRHFPYRDTVGKLTIGFGRNLDDRGVSRAEAELMLTNDVLGAEAALYLAVPWAADLDDVRRRVLVELAFNMGVGSATRGLLSFKATLAHIEAGRWQAAAAGLLRSKWANQVGPARSARLAYMLETGRD